MARLTKNGTEDQRLASCAQASHFGFQEKSVILSMR